MDNSFTVNAALIAAISAVIAPTITALIHSVKEYKISQKRIMLPKKLEAIETFSLSYSNCGKNVFLPSICLIFYKDSMFLATLCTKKKTKEQIIELGNQVLSSGTSSQTDKLFIKCIKAVALET